MSSFPIAVPTSLVLCSFLVPEHQPLRKGVSNNQFISYPPPYPILKLWPTTLVYKAPQCPKY